MTQQSPVTATRGAQSGPTTAVMRAVASPGPKVLRIGAIQGGRVVEERIIRHRGEVTIGPNEKNMFVVTGAELPGSHCLFERGTGGYKLNFLDGMTGRVALPGGLMDLERLKREAGRSGRPGYQIELSDECRGKIVVGKTTFLFQFVPPPPPQPRPQLPVSVTRGSVTVDWPTTMIAAFSFLAHFLAIGAVYSDWLDPVVDYDLNVGSLVETVKNLPKAPPLELPEEPEAEETEQPEAAPDPKPKPKAAAKPKPQAKPTGKRPISAKEAAALGNELESLEMATLAALSGTGPATANVLRNGEVPTSALDAAAKSEAGVSAGGPGGLKLKGSGGTVRPGAAGGGLASIGKTSKSAASGSGAKAKVKGPRGNASVGKAAVAGGSVSGASRVVARMRAGFRACYNRGLASDPDLSGKISLKIAVGPGGQVLSVKASTTGSLPDSVVECVKARAKSARFAPPQGGRAVVQVPVSFVKQ